MTRRVGPPLSVRARLFAWEDWFYDQPALVMLPIVLGVMLVAVAVGLIIIISVVWLLGGPQSGDSSFLENGMRCRWTYVSDGKATLAQKQCMVLPELTPVVKR